MRISDWPVGIVQLAAQPLDVDVDDVGERVVVLVPDVLGDVGAADDLAGAAREVFEQRVLAAGQRDLAAVRPDPLARDVDGQVADLDPFRATAGAGRGASARARARAARGNRTAWSGSRRRRRRGPATRASTASRAVSISTGTSEPGGAQLAAHRQAVLAREHHVEDHGVVVVLLAPLGRRRRRRRDVNGVPGFAQPLRDEAGRARLVLDQQDPHVRNRCYFLIGLPSASSSEDLLAGLRLDLSLVVRLAIRRDRFEHSI